ncbi:YcnI family protein [Agromyces sp. LHK192]|uniref:YcnI family copper-binding membrane protein n=1 Tax=Agromyces sp. LHK192 TaxID=2498704 RepID=UPI0013E3C013|nr:YcnI family protein [Agromyces sp. LHK192]
MTRTTRTRTALASSVALGGGLLLALAAPLSASAHVGVTPSSTAAGSYTVLGFSIPHGCGDSPTTKVTFTIPEGINSVTPTVNPNWTIAEVSEELPEPIVDSHGASVVERDAQVVYTAITPLDAHQRDVLELSLQLPEDAEGEDLVFPVLQECVEGTTDWSQVAEEGGEEPESPAPVITVTAAEGDGHGHGADEEAAEPISSEHDHGAEAESASTSSDDAVARWLAVGGIAVGAVGIVLAVLARRKPTTKA